MKSLIFFTASVIILVFAVAALSTTMGTYFVYGSFLFVFIALCLSGAAVESAGKEVSHE